MIERRTRAGFRSRGIGALLLILLAFAGCDSGPGGPGTLELRAEGEGLGGAVLEITGSGIVGFEGRGSTQVYSGAVPGRPGAHRVILVAPTGGSLGLGIQVEDVRMEGPAVHIVSAAATSNGLLPTSTVRIRVERAGP